LKYDSFTWIEEVGVQSRQACKSIQENKQITSYEKKKMREVRVDKVSKLTPITASTCFPNSVLQLLMTAK
jgi:hypothetical protein